jgi:hypothetical protein
MTTLIGSTTLADNTATFTVSKGNTRTIVAFGLTGTEEIGFEIAYATDSYTDVMDPETGSQYCLSATNNVVPVSTPGDYRLDKPPTNGAVLVKMWSQCE